MIRLVILIILFEFSIADSQWVINFYKEGDPYCNIQMLNEQVVLTSTYDSSEVYKTTDAGNTWILIRNAQNNLGIADFSFVNEMVGYLVGNYGIKTTNGGINWSNFYPGDGVEFLNELTGYIIFMDGGIYRTTNGGQTYWNWWVTTIEPRGLDFINVNTGWVVGRPLVANVCYKTTNAGFTWFLQNINTPLDRVAVSFLDSNYGIAVGSGFFSFTKNGGSYWTGVNSTMGGEYTDVQFVSRDVIYAVGIYGKIIKSTDGGVSWFMQNSGTTAHLSGVSFINENTGFACGENIILKTTNGGISGVVPISNNIPSEFRLYQNYPNPFNPSTTIKFDIAKATMVTMVIYDILGRETETLINERLKPGQYSYIWNGGNHSSGIYLCRLITDEFTATRKMIMVK